LPGALLQLAILQFRIEGTPRCMYPSDAKLLFQENSKEGKDYGESRYRESEGCK
jgi:hypothetical protein